jgi:hypothetical protein
MTLINEQIEFVTPEMFSLINGLEIKEDISFTEGEINI